MKGQRGSAYITVLMVVLIISVLSIGLLSAVMSDYRIAMADANAQEAYYVADGAATKLYFDISNRVRNIYTALKQEADGEWNKNEFWYWLLGYDEGEWKNEYISQRLYDRIRNGLSGYPAYSDIPSFDSSDGKTRQAALKNPLNITDEGSTVKINMDVVGRTGNASATVHVSLGVNKVVSGDTQLILSKALAQSDSIWAILSSPTIEGDVMTKGRLYNSIFGIPVQTITITGDLYAQSGFNGGRQIIINGQIKPMDDQLKAQLDSIFGQLSSGVYSWWPQFVSGKIGSSSNPAFIKGREIFVWGDTDFTGVIYSDDLVFIADGAKITGSVIAEAGVQFVGGSFTRNVTIKHDQMVINNLQNNQQFADFFRGTGNGGDLVYVSEWRQIQ